ncbi:MAG: hypothetical protein NTV28_09430 [Propionibacteriales bacterium]|nr:hypothetical protein [Propionibacteriales bacterium]
MSSATGSVIHEVDFGYYDAESDGRLLDYFLVTGQARRAASGAHLVLGRKGSGKTAIFRHLASTLTEDTAVVELDLENYVFQFHRGLKEQGINERFAYTTSWRLLILISAYLRVRSDLKRGARKDGDEALRSIGLGPNRGPFSAILDWLGRVRKVEMPRIEGLASLGGFEVEAPADASLDLRTITALEALEALIVTEAARRPIAVLIDRLDDAWDGSQESRELITGAVRATRDLNQAIQGRPGPSDHIPSFRHLGEVGVQRQEQDDPTCSLPQLDRF